MLVVALSLYWGNEGCRIRAAYPSVRRYVIPCPRPNPISRSPCDTICHMHDSILILSKWGPFRSGAETVDDSSDTLGTWYKACAQRYHESLPRSWVSLTWSRCNPAPSYLSNFP